MLLGKFLTVRNIFIPPSAPSSLPPLRCIQPHMKKHRERERRRDAHSSSRGWGGGRVARGQCRWRCRSLRLTRPLTVQNCARYREHVAGAAHVPRLVGRGRARGRRGRPLAAAGPALRPRPEPRRPGAGPGAAAARLLAAPRPLPAPLEARPPDLRHVRAQLRPEPVPGEPGRAAVRAQRADRQGVGPRPGRGGLPRGARRRARLHRAPVQEALPAARGHRHVGRLLVALLRRRAHRHRPQQEAAASGRALRADHPDRSAGAVPRAARAPSACPLLLQPLDDPGGAQGGAGRAGTCHHQHPHREGALKGAPAPAPRT